jgi:hypothetical protein
VNDDLLANLAVDLQDYTFNIFRFNETHLGYNDGYLSFGFSAVILDNPIKKKIANQYVAKLLESLTPEEVPELPPVEPHLIAMMEETERRY